jgi:hypothetical protein
MTHEYLNYNGLALYNRLIHDELDALKNIYAALQSKIVVAEELPRTGQLNTIYRIAGTNSYKDYMWNGVKFIQLAEYDNAIDDVPMEDSNNLVKSGGVYSSVQTISEALEELREIVERFYQLDLVPTKDSKNAVESGGIYDFVMANSGAFDVSSYNNGKKYADIEEAFEDIPEDVKHGGMSICFINSETLKYEQWRNTSDEFSLQTEDWQGVDGTPTEGSNNLITSGGVKQALDNVEPDMYHVVLTQAEYDSLPVKRDDTIYLIVPPQSTWVFGDPFPVVLA